MTKVKICGITREEDILAINVIEPDFIGFVFAKSKRQISYEKAKILKQMLNKSIKSVGVFVNERLENVANACNCGIIDIVQLHGDENNEYINDLRQKVDNQIIKAIRVKNEQDVLESKNYNCDLILFDAYLKDSYGGGGEVFNWELLKNYDKPYILAGGLNEQNIENAIKTLSPYAVDVSSGVELCGLKNKDKMSTFINIVRRIQK